MRIRLTSAVLVGVGVGFLGCSNPPTGTGSASGSLAISRDDGLVYAADGDLDSVFVFDTRALQTLGTIKVGRQPEKVLLGPDGTLYVANRLGRTVSVVHPGELTEAARIPVGVEPMGLAVSGDGRTLYVVNSTSVTQSDFGTVMAFDTGTLERQWELPVGPEPRAIALVGDNRAAVTLYKSGDIVLVDLAKPTVVKAGTDVYAQLNRSVLAGGAPNLASTVQPVALEAATTSLDGRHLYVPAIVSSDALVVTTPSSVPAGTQTGGTGYSSGGSCGLTGVAAAGLLTFDVSGHALVDDVVSCQTDGSTHPATLVNTGRKGASVQGLRALATDPTGAFLYLAGFGSNNVAIMPTTSREIDGQLSPSVGLAAGTVSQLVAVGAGPSGIAVTRSGTEAWVFNALDHSLSRLAAQNGRVANVGTFSLASDVLPTDVVAGRKLFFGAVDGRMIDPSAGLACSSCHLEGREDGHVWNFQEGPRQTPSLAGRMVLKTAPYHWNGEFADLGAFMSLTVQRRMGGTGVTPVMVQQVAAFLDWLPGPDNPHQRSTSAELIAKGRAAFDKAQCGTCHAGMPFTNDSFADVGTLVHAGSVVDRVDLLPHGALNTPSLLGVARTAPYLHDGSAASLKARILQGKSTDLHGKTSLLSDTEVDDLVSYLKTL